MNKDDRTSWQDFRSGVLEALSIDSDRRGHADLSGASISVGLACNEWECTLEFTDGHINNIGNTLRGDSDITLRGSSNDIYKLVLRSYSYRDVQDTVAFEGDFMGLLVFVGIVDNPRSVD